MGLIDRFRRKSFVPDEPAAPMPGFRVVFDRYSQFVTDEATLGLMRAGRAQRTAQEQFYVLDLLAEDGRATDLDEGFGLSEDQLVRLESDDAQVLGLPPLFAGRLEITVQKWTASPDFRVAMDLINGSHPQVPDRRGPVVHVSGEVFRLDEATLVALRAVEEHSAMPAGRRAETDNVRLVAQLHRAQRLSEEQCGSPLFSLGALDRFTTVEPTSVALTVEPQADGSLVVEPDLGRDVDHAAVSTRLHQLDAVGDRSPSEGVLRADHTLVLLGEEQVAAVREVRKTPVIPADQVTAFLAAPGAFYDPELVDVDARFSVRVAGLGVLAPVSFEQAATTGLDWFAGDPETSGPTALVEKIRTTGEQTVVEASVDDAWERGESILTVGEKIVDISDRGHVTEVLQASRRRLAELGVTPEPDAATEDDGHRVTVGMHIHDAVGTAEELRALGSTARPERPIDYSRLLRSPFPHQRTGIEWMAGLAGAALSAQDSDPVRVQGALLADDMGLGKTYMTLVALAEVMQTQWARGETPLPVLGVMPVALLENWLAEIRSTFGSERGPFEDIVVLQGSGIADYKIRGAVRETAARVEDLDEQGMVRGDAIHASLRIGPEWGAARLDRPGVLVLTTYEALRRYQISLGLVEWGIVVLDEAQATKNPEILTTRAAKALKARFKLLATGTPVENSLRDFWTLVDTAQPGLLGSWSDFQETWVSPMSAASPADHERLGRELREAVGPFMLRRVKEDHLVDLPAKHVHEYRQAMPPAQVQAYDSVLQAHRRGVQGAALKTLHGLSAASLHPGLVSGGLDGGMDGSQLSARTIVAIEQILDGVRAAGEKAIVFVKTKEMQRALALWLGTRYDLRVDIVNGDTAATGRGETRLKKIREFEAREGFNVILLSPLAVGVGLTIVGANHAIHLERHWNPAKEAQATDRIHRIGQVREVHVHHPVATHPDVESFDVNLDRLLRSKVALKDAVVVPQEVSSGELESVLGLG